jgi:diaminopimelate decarboxylase
MKLLKKLLYPFIRVFITVFRRNTGAALPHSLWGASVNSSGSLEIGGCDCISLVEEFGTPLFVVDQMRLVDNYRSFHAALAAQALDFEIYYSYKTNPVPGILRILHEQGAGAEVISPYELWLAGKLGVAAAKTVYNGPNKSAEGLERAIAHKIRLININSFSEIAAIADIARRLRARPRVGIRVTTRGGWSHQFGFAIETGDAFKAMAELVRLDACAVEGIHVHLGSGLKSTGLYEKAIAEITGLMQEIRARLGITIRYLDLGGGFGVGTVRSVSGLEIRLQEDFSQAYRPPQPDQTPTLAEFATALARTLKENCARRGLDLPTLLVEPGRALTSNAQVLITRVGDIKSAGESQVALADAGINLARPLSWEYHEIFAANKMMHPRSRPYGIAGPICTPMDLYVKSKWLPALEIGDLLAIMDAGAYFTSFSTDFSFPRPAIVAAAAGKARVLREKATFNDLIRLDGPSIPVRKGEA